MIDCPHAALCTGCTRLSQPYDQQLADKAAVVVAALRRYAELEAIAVEPCAPATPNVRYRTRAKWVVDRGRVGLFARGSEHDVVDLPGCVVVPPGFAAVATALRARLADGGAAAAAVTGLDVRQALDRGREALLVTVVHDRALRDADAALAPLVEALARVPGVVGVARAPRDLRSPLAFGAPPRPLVGATRALDGGHLATFGAFVQAHRGQAAAIAAVAAGALTETGSRSVLELFGGAGALGLALARAGADVELVEVVEAAADAAAEVARSEGLSLRARAADATRLSEREPARDLVVVDPPRRGLSPRLRELVARLARRAVVYVSCDPATLARDLAHLARLGLSAALARPFDMIPQSDAVEVVVVLRPAPPPPPRLLHEDEEVLVVDKPPHLSMRALEARVAARSPRAVALGWLPPQASGVVVFARSVVAAARASSAIGDTTLAARVRGVPHARGVLARVDGRPALSFVRGAVDGGHAAIELGAAPRSRLDPLPALARIGHPALGDARHGHAPTNAHFFAAAGLDRAWLHAARVVVRGRAVESPLAPDLFGA